MELYRYNKTKYRTAILFVLFSMISVSIFSQIDAETQDLYDGSILPCDFDAFFAPQNTLKLPFTSADSSAIQLAEILPEGSKVHAGQVIATFVFRWDQAKERIEQRINQVETQKQEDNLKLQKEIDGLKYKVQKAKIQVDRSELELQKKQSLSKIKQQILDCDNKIIIFEEKSLRHKLKAAQENLSTCLEWHDKNILLWRGYRETFSQTKERYQVKAHCDGTLFYPVITKLKRKIQKGDRVDSGTHFLSIIKSKRYELVFFLPENDYLRITSISSFPFLWNPPDSKNQSKGGNSKDRKKSGKKEKKFKKGKNSGKSDFSGNSRVKIAEDSAEKTTDQMSEAGKIFIVSGGKELPVKIREVSYFPQTIGDLKLNQGLPDAWDKCFVVKADLPDSFISSDNGNSMMNNVKVRFSR
ncbi:MAG: hypothetical protein HQM10_23110 [Candidatus Riflebacteria bacterium]|nr:hypothetical protein [Candidatus Riflebacteria bacterium]